ncbi:MAG: WblI protein [Candidatus Midichloriaceae bacterium]|jgi:glycosyltransferase involved in cell wall biosynthesis|nr:WblI protein [Candidatus Midichloriaceae bacterium]
MGMEFRPYYLAREWLKIGHKPLVIAATYSHVRKIQPKSSGHQQIDGVDHLWLKTNKYTGNGIMRFISMILFMLQLIVRAPALAMQKPDVVIASSTYPLDIFPAFLIAKFSGAKLVFEIHDLWPLSPIELGGMSKWHPFILVMRFAEWFAYKMSDKIVSILPCTFSHVALDGVKKENFLHIPNGICLGDEKKSLDTKDNTTLSLIKNLKGQGRMVIAYTGALGVANALDNLVQAALRVMNLPVTFLIVGDGPEKENLKKSAPSNVIFIDKMSKDEISVILKHVDFAYMGLQKTELFKFGISPNKLYDYMFAGAPIISAIESGQDLVDEVKCGISIAAENPEALAKAIEEAIHLSKKERSKMGRRAKEYVIANHDYKVLAQRFVDFLRG